MFINFKLKFICSGLVRIPMDIHELIVSMADW